ncbi:hypothetical protein Q9966_003179 [Columba livia]|nr:hypothetical protein Q9966_003179 [Columba livia]
MAPMVKSTSRPKWQRIPSKNVYYYRCPDHRKNYVMSFAFCFDREADTYQFAYCYPYTYTRLQHYLDSLQRRSMGYFCRELLALSVQKRRLDLLTITSPDLSGICCCNQSAVPRRQLVLHRFVQSFHQRPEHDVVLQPASSSLQVLKHRDLGAGASVSSQVTCPQE